jgi:ascorbate-specific PTS system EIIC-type component UlaA
MKKKAFLATLTSFLLSAQQARAELTNPVVESSFGSGSEEAASGSTFAEYFVFFWNALISIGAIMVLVFFVWGAIEWISSGGDKGKVENARNRITQAVIGLIILVGSYAIIGFIGEIFFGDTFSILQINIPETN